MNVLVVSFLILYIPIRAIGLGVSIEFLHDTRDNKYIYFIIGWTCWIIGVLLPIFADFTPITNTTELLLVLNVMFAAIGAVFYLGGIFKYFMTVSFKKIITITTSFIITAFLVYLYFDYTFSIFITSTLLNITMATIYIVPPLKKKDFMKYMGKSIRWYLMPILVTLVYLPISIYISFSGETFNLYTSENNLLILLNYIPPIVVNILLILMLIHLEYDISSNVKFKLKDKYSHDLGNIMQVIYSSANIIKITNKSENNYEEYLQIVEEKCEEAAQLIKEIRDL